MIEEAYEEKKTINATKNKATRSVIITDSNHVILSAIEPNTLKRRLEEGLGR